MWEIPHSVFCIVLMIVPLVLWLRLPKLTIVSYSSHLMLDLLTHTGEWAVKPFYPLEWTVAGFADAWAWPIRDMMISWGVLATLIVSLALWKKADLLWRCCRSESD